MSLLCMLSFLLQAYIAQLGIEDRGLSTSLAYAQSCCICNISVTSSIQHKITGMLADLTKAQRMLASHT